MGSVLITQQYMNYCQSRVILFLTIISKIM